MRRDEGGVRSRLRSLGGRLFGGQSEVGPDLLAQLKEELSKSYRDKTYNGERVCSIISGLKLDHSKTIRQKGVMYEDSWLVLAIKNLHVDAVKALFEGDRQSWPVSMVGRKHEYAGDEWTEKSCPVLIALYEVAHELMSSSLPKVRFADGDESTPRVEQLEKLRELAEFLLRPRYGLADTMQAPCYVTRQGQTYMTCLMEGLLARYQELTEDPDIEALHPFALQRLIHQQDSEGLKALVALLGPLRGELHNALERRAVTFREAHVFRDALLPTQGQARGTWFDYLLLVHHIVGIKPRFLAALSEIGYRFQISDYQQAVRIIELYQKKLETAPDSEDVQHQLDQAVRMIIAILEGIIIGKHDDRFHELLSALEQSRLTYLVCGHIWMSRRENNDIHQPRLELMQKMLSSLSKPQKVMKLLSDIKEKDPEYYTALNPIGLDAANQVQRLVAICRARSSRRRPVERSGEAATAADPQPMDPPEEMYVAMVNGRLAAIPAMPAADGADIYDVAALPDEQQKQNLLAALTEKNYARLTKFVRLGYQFDLVRDAFLEHFDEDADALSAFVEQVIVDAKKYPDSVPLQVLQAQFAPADYEDMTDTNGPLHLEPLLPSDAAEGAATGARPRAATPPVQGVYGQALPVGVGDDPLYEDPDGAGYLYEDANTKRHGVVVDGTAYAASGMVVVGAADDDDFYGVMPGSGAPGQSANVYGEGGSAVVMLDGMPVTVGTYANGPALIASSDAYAGASGPSGTHDPRPMPLPKPRVGGSSVGLMPSREVGLALSPEGKRDGPAVPVSGSPG